jgi:ATP-dependent exoDNAse (exonuclease V) beta subunit
MLTLNPGSEVVESGSESWFEKHGFEGKKADTAARNEIRLVPCTAGTPHALSPSSLHESPLPPSSSDQGRERGSFSPDAADLGTEIHEVLSRIAWDAAESDLSGCSDKAHRLIAAFLGSEGAGRVFTQPHGASELWRERRFDLMLEGAWISGCFDRVVIRRDNDRVIGVDLIDFKTDSCAPEFLPERHAGQMASYRKVLSRLLGIKESLITPLLVHVRTGALMPVVSS